MKDWEKDPEFLEIQATLMLAGADGRALPHYIKALLAQARKEERAKCNKEMGEEYHKGYNKGYSDAKSGKNDHYVL